MRKGDSTEGERKRTSPPEALEDFDTGFIFFGDYDHNIATKQGAVALGGVER